MSGEAIAADKLQMRLGESQATGALSWRGGDVPQLDADIDLNRIDLDRFLPAEEVGDAGQPGDEAALVPLQTISDNVRQVIPADVAATIDLKIGTLTWREGVIRQARTRLVLDDGVVALQPASALLPGGADVRFAGRLTQGGDRPWLQGVVEIAADDLRAILSWLSVDVSDVPADRLRRLNASADLSAIGNRLSTTNLDVRIDTTRIAGDAAIAADERPRVTAALAVNTVNVDAYLPPAGETGAGSEETASPVPETASEDAWAGLANIDADVTLKMDALIYDGVHVAGLELDAAHDDGNLTLRRAQVADVAGAGVSVSGTAHTVWSAPTVDLAVESTADSLEGVVAFLDIDPEIRTQAFGKFALQGFLKGGEDALSLDFTLAAGTAGATIEGTVDDPFGAPAGALALRLRASDAAALARTAGLTPPAPVERLGALSIDGGIGGDLKSLAVNLSAEAAGATVTASGKVTELLTSPGYSVDVDLAHPSGEALVATVIGEVPAGAALGPVRLVGKVSGDRMVANLAGIDAAIGESTLAGDIFLRLDQDPPAFSAAMRAGLLDLAWIGGGLAAADGNAGTGIEVTELYSDRWSDEPIDLALLDRLSGTLTLAAEAIVLGPYRIEQADVDIAAGEGTLTLRSLGGRLFGGALEADGSLAGAPMPAGQAAVQLSDANIGAILRETAGGRAVSGKATIDGYFTLRGQTEREMVESLAGRVTITSDEGAVEGVDVPAISRQIAALSEADALDDIVSFVDRAEQSLSSGQTTIHSLDGIVRVQNGQVRIDGFEIVTDGGVGTINGTADLPAWQLDLTALFRLEEHAEAPPVGVHLGGPIDRPERRYLIEEMQAHLVKLGLLSLAGSTDAPKITLRKGAKAEPGTEMDTLLRNVLGDPDEAEDAADTRPADARAGANETGKALEVPDQDDAGGALLSLDDVPDNPVVVEEPLGAGQAEEPADPEQVEQQEVLLETEDLEQPAAAPSPDEPEPAPPSDEAVPEPPSAPERYRAETLQDFVDDVLGEPDPDQDADLQEAVDDPLKESEPERGVEESQPDPDEGFQDFVDDLLESLDE